MKVVIIMFSLLLAYEVFKYFKVLFEVNNLRQEVSSGRKQNIRSEAQNFYNKKQQRPQLLYCDLRRYSA